VISNKFHIIITSPNRLKSILLINEIIFNKIFYYHIMIIIIFCTKQISILHYWITTNSCWEYISNLCVLQTYISYTIIFLKRPRSWEILNIWWDMWFIFFLIFTQFYINLFKTLAECHIIFYRILQKSFKKKRN